MKQYVIASATSAALLISEVNQLLRKGWRLRGDHSVILLSEPKNPEWDGPRSHELCWSQTMVKIAVGK